MKSNEKLQVNLFSATLPVWVERVAMGSFKNEFEKISLISKDDNKLPSSIKNIKI